MSFIRRIANRLPNLKKFNSRSKTLRAAKVRKLGLEQLDARRVLATTTVIIDNSASCPQHCKVGSWATATGYGYGGSIAFSSAPFTGSDVATWWFNGIDPGQYRVSATWHFGGSIHGSDIPITVYSSQPSSTSVVIGSGVLNQQLSADDFQDAGVYWENIGVFTTATNQLGIKMTDLSNGHAIADAMRIERIVPTTDTAIIDNDKPGFSKSGTWATASAVTGAYGGAVSWNSLPNDGSEVAEWTFNVVPGVYRLSTSLHSGLSTHASNNVVSVYNGANLIGSSTLDQTVSYSDYFLDSAWWKQLGTFSATSTLRVRMTDLSNGYVIADAFRIQRVAESTPVPIQPATSIAIVNPSFEAQALADGDTGPYLTGLVTGWGAARLLNPNATHFASGVATDGQNVLTSPLNSQLGYVSQVLTHVPLPRKEYRLQVDVGDRIDTPFDGWRIELRSNSQVLAAIYSESLSIADGYYSTAELVYTTSDTAPTGPLEIVLIETNSVPNGVVSFDNVRLTMREARFATPTANDDLLYYTPVSTDLTVGAGSSLILNDSEAEGTARFAFIVEYPVHGIISSFNSDGTFVYRPDPGFAGTDSFAYRIHNGVYQSEVARAQISVGTKLLTRLNRDSNVFNPTPQSPGFGIGYSNVPAGSSMETDGALAKTGGLLLAEDILPGLSLIYRSDELTRPIIEVESQFPVGPPVPSSVFAQLVFNGVPSDVFTFSVPSGANGIVAGDRFRIALQADASSLPTGRYNYQVYLATSAPGQNMTFSGSKTVVNRSQSAFGKGWSLDGIDRVKEQADGLLLVRGNGDSLWFPKQGSSFGFADGDTSFLKAVKNPDGSFSLTSKEGLVLSFNQLGLMISQRDRSNNVYTFAYADRNGDAVAEELVSITEPYGRVTSLAYANGRVSSLQHFSGRTTQLTYSDADLSGYSLTDPDGAGLQVSPTIAFAYAPTQLSRTNSLGQATVYTFDPTHGRLTKVNYANNDEWQLLAEETSTLPVGPLTTLKKSSGVFAIVTDGKNIGGGEVWKFQSDRFGYITKSITTLGNTRTYLRNANGQVYETTDPDPDNEGDQAAPITKIGYNNFGDTTVIVSPDGGTTKIKYTEKFHQPVLVVDPVGRTNRSLYDGVGNEIQSIDGLGYVTQRIFNARGQATQVTSPDPDGGGPQSSQVTSYGYDGFGRLVSVLFPNGGTNTLGYTSADELNAVFDENNKLTTWTYDYLGRNTFRRNRVNALEQTIFDALSRPVKLIDALGKVTDLTYDLRERIETIAYPDPSVPGVTLPRPIDVFVYDKNGNLIARKNPDSYYVGDLRYKYNPENRLSGRSHSAYIPQQPGSDPQVFETYDYDNIGRLSKVNKVKGDLAEDILNPPAAGLSDAYLGYTYDSVGRIATEIHFDQITGEFYSLTYAYNAAGELISRTDNNSNVASNVYDARGFLLQETSSDPDKTGLLFPLTTRYSYDALGRLTTLDRGFGRVSSYEYNNRNWLTKVTEPDPDGIGPLSSPVNQFTYNLRGDQLSEISPLGRVTTYGYDDEQRLVSRLDPDPDGAGPLTSPLTVVQYDAANRVIGEINPRGAYTGYDYDSLGRVTLITSPDPDDAGPLTTPTTRYVYSERGLQGIIDPLGRNTATFQLDKAGRRTAVTDSSGATTNYTYNFYDQVRTTVGPDPDGAGIQTPSTEELQYDWDGRLSRKIDAKGGITQWTYDILSNVKEISDPRGNKTTFEYDSLNRVIAERKTVSTYGATPTTGEVARSYQYDVAGNLTRTKDRNGRITQFIYDKLDRVTDEKWIPNGTVDASVTAFTDGKKLSEIQKVGWTAPLATTMSGTFLLNYGTTFTAPIAWDASAATIRAALEAIPQIGVGNVDVTVTNVATVGREITLTFKNALLGINVNQVAISIQNLVRNTGTIAIIQRTDVQGSSTPEVQRLTLPRFATTAGFDGVWYVAFGSEISGPLAGTASTTDIANALNAFAGIDSVTVTGIYPNFEVTFGGTQLYLDLPLIRMDTNNLYKSLEVSRTITSNYNADDELVTIADPTATITYTRDNLGRATTIQNQIRNANVEQSRFTFNQSFDSASNRTRLTAAHTSGTDFVNDYIYDKLDRLTDISQSNTSQAKRVKMTYNALGQRTQLDRYESLVAASSIATTSYTYDTANRLKRIEHTKGATVFNAHDYIFDNMSRITSVTSKIGPVDLNGQPRPVNFVYDKLSQLESAEDGSVATRPGSQAFSFTYDANGNRNSTGYSNDVDNRVKTGPGGESYVYDLEGNITQILVNGLVAQLFTWDHRNRLTSVVNSPGSFTSTTVNYQYDAFNRLVLRTVSGATSGPTTWGYDEGINPLLEANSNGRTHRYLWSDQVDELLADEQNPTGTASWNTLWALSDHQGTVKDLLDYNPATGVSSIVNSRTYDAFGNLKSQTGSTDMPIGYTGKYYDLLTGLQNSWNRWYSPKLGRFISQDPIGFGGGDENLYRYGGNSPTNATDPSGLIDRNDYEPDSQQILNRIGNLSSPNYAEIWKLKNEGLATVHNYRASATVGDYRLRFLVPLQRADGTQDVLVFNHTYGWFSNSIKYDSTRRGGTPSAIEQSDSAASTQMHREIMDYNVKKMEFEFALATTSLPLGGGGAMRKAPVRTDYSMKAVRERWWGGKAPVRPNPDMPRGREYMELSHTYISNNGAVGKRIPDWIKNRGWNLKPMWGSEHALVDPHRYRFMRRSWKDANEIYSPMMRMLGRMPTSHKVGAGVVVVGGAGYGLYEYVDGDE